MGGPGKWFVIPATSRVSLVFPVGACTHDHALGRTFFSDPSRDVRPFGLVRTLAKRERPHHPVLTIRRYRLTTGPPGWRNR